MMRRSGHSLARLLGLAGALALAAACSVRSQLLKNELQSLERQFQACSALEQELNANPVPDAVSDFSVFIPATFINEVLKGFENETIGLPTNPPATITLTKLEAAFGCDAATVAVSVNATRGNLTVGLTLQAAATLEMDPSRTSARVLLNVERVEPTIQVPWFKFALRGLVRDLVELAFVQYSQRLPVLTVPLRHGFDLRVPDTRMNQVRVPAGDGVLFGTVVVPGLTRSGTLSLRRTMFLADGIHAFFSVSQE